MKTIRLLLTLFAALTFFVTGCSHKVYKSTPLPPGQAKKVDGSKSAKDYAPGHNKKYKPNK